MIGPSASLVCSHCWPCPNTEARCHSCPLPPIDITKVLERVGVRPEDTETIAEEVVDGHAPEHRPIHGNVSILLRECSLAESITLDMSAVRASIGHGRTVIVIYDSLERLKREETAVRKTLIDAGVPGAEILTINSIDDSERKPGEPRRGQRYADPRDYDVLLCTSSVEIGVTFRSTLMFTEPGHGLASFVQRVGRVSRGADDGQVIVSLSDRRRSREAWTRRIANVIECDDAVDVQTFIGDILRDVRRRLEPTRKEVATDSMAFGAAVPFYRRASWRGAFWAALFVAAIRRTKMTVQKEARARLHEIAPGVVKFVDVKIGQILSVDVVNDNLRRQSQPHKRWVNALLASALTYRDIGAAIMVVDPNGTRHTVSESFLRRATDILNRHIAVEEDGERVVHLLSRDSGPGNQSVSRQTGCAAADAVCPVTDRRRQFLAFDPRNGTREPNSFTYVWWRNGGIDSVGSFLHPERPCGDPRKKVMGAATALVEKLGRPPLDEDYEDSTESALFA